jgi:hypothetical protein
VVKLDDGVWEATSLVLVSDVGLIAKTSRKELFVFTQNLKDDKVEAGAKVVVLHCGCGCLGSPVRSGSILRQAHQPARR